MILKHGGSPIMWKTGHSLIKAKMKETDAELAGEMSGHFFFRERWYGFDDGIYAAARLLEILAGDAEGAEPEEIFAELPKGVSTPELKIAMQEASTTASSSASRKKPASRALASPPSTACAPTGPTAGAWCGPPTPRRCWCLRFDADSDAALLRIQDAYRQQLMGVDPTLQLPF
jgi:phosphomannomutase/phosphoglucomutase